MLSFEVRFKSDEMLIVVSTVLLLRVNESPLISLNEIVVKLSFKFEIDIWLNLIT